MHDIHGKAVHIGDKVKTKTNESFYVNGGILDSGTVIGGNVAGAKYVAFAHDCEVIEKHPSNEGKDSHGGGSIVWGNGPINT
jgi:hypothetical protein